MTTSTSQGRDALWAAARDLTQHRDFRDTIWRLCDHRNPETSIEKLGTRVHPDDQMLRHLLRHYGEVNRSVSQYFSVALQQNLAAQQILAALFPHRAARFSFLDFACGFGRLLRFLTLNVAPDQIWASDIQRDAVDFVAGAFGIHGLYCDADPSAFEPGRRFDMIWVASLFSHLPSPLFRGWLARLMRLVDPDGVLCFSVHDESLVRKDAVLIQPGFHYLARSEIEEFDSSAYGTSYVSEAFVRELVSELGGSSWRCVRLPRALANEQDIYVVTRSATRPLDALASFTRGAWGCVDDLTVYTSGRVYMSGWAASLDRGQALSSIDVRVDGTPHPCPTGVKRDDLRAALGEALARAGWEFNVNVRREAYIDVVAGDSPLERSLLYAGRVDVRSGPLRVDDAQETQRLLG